MCYAVMIREELYTLQMRCILEYGKGTCVDIPEEFLVEKIALGVPKGALDRRLSKERGEIGRRSLCRVVCIEKDTK